MGKFEFVLTKDLYEQSKKERISLSQLLERLDPSTEGSKLTAFERQLKEHNIVAQSIAGKSIYASNVDVFYRTEESKVLFPEFIATTLRESIMAESILPYLIALTTPIDSNAYRTIYCINTPSNKKAAQRKRVTEAADLPKSKLVTAEHTTNIYKYGNAIETSYESLRRIKIDLLQLHVKRIGQEAAHAEVLDILDVIKDGDGNLNPATVYRNTTLDTTATAGTLSQKAFVSFLLKFFPNRCNTIIANEAGLLQVLNIIYPAATASQLVAAMLMGAMPLPQKVQMPQGLFIDFVLLYEPQLETINGNAAIYGLDKRYAIEKVIETGSDISEAAAFIANQTQLLTISENAGFDKVLTEASAILEVN